MILLSPSVLSADLAQLGAQSKKVLDAGADMIHFDVMDGIFVDNLSFGLPVLACLRSALPEAVMDVHLMIQHPLRYITQFQEAGADYITFHVETTDDIPATLQAIRGVGCKPGLAVNPDTPVETVFPYLDQLDLVLIMGVVPGHGGQAFRAEALDKLKKLSRVCRDRGLSPLISVDGGVKAETTAPLCVQAGANTLVAGSAVFQAEDAALAVSQFKHL